MRNSSNTHSNTSSEHGQDGSLVTHDFPAAAVYRGKVFHKRFRPHLHSLDYSVYSFLLDIDRLDEAAAATWCFSRNRWNLYSFYDKDFGCGREGKLRDFVLAELSNVGVCEPVSRIEVLCYPRVLGYAFNPLSIFYCYRPAGSVAAILYEVHNTFGESQTYVFPLPTDAVGAKESSASGQQHEIAAQTISENASVPGSTADHSRTAEWARHKCVKKMHVSPFTPMDMEYDFRITSPAESIIVAIQVRDTNGLMLSASFKGARTVFSNERLLGLLLTYPLMTAKIIGGIHWEAFRLWIKGVPWFAHSKKVS